MVELKVSEIENFLARPTRPIVLIYGPDAGLVRERAEALVRKSVDDPKDPFQLARLDGDDLSSEPTRPSRRPIRFRCSERACARHGVLPRNRGKATIFA